ncbi:hypothetical protein [Massilia sp. MS-15]|uniref:hypothetical protein n=1 Tax=Massilia sp. MS-15 TaxID=2878200 RepID=UPI001CD6EA3A|nr:hypothetical protein [Massilia sp. MS-15]MCA1247012.1 hypothetical protein [Massilia sp. MS-15]
MLSNIWLAQRRTLAHLCIAATWSATMRIAVHLPPKRALARWCVFGALCGMVLAACFIGRFPLLQG